MKLYLDIDGVLLTVKNKRAADHVDVFVKFITEKFDCYWLTTHCKGNAQTAIQYLSSYLCQSTLHRLNKVKTTNWDTLKTEGIDFESDFVWIADYVMNAERQDLKKFERERCLILVNLNETTLLDLTKILQESIARTRTLQD